MLLNCNHSKIGVPIQLLNLLTGGVRTNALAGLYILELYLVKFIGNRDRDLDVPNDISKLFELIDFQTNNTVVGHESYLVTSQDITTLFESYSNE